LSTAHPDEVEITTASMMKTGCIGFGGFGLKVIRTVAPAVVAKGDPMAIDGCDSESAKRGKAPTPSIWSRRAARRAVTGQPLKSAESVEVV
jgi:hypothetical protein